MASPAIETARVIGDASALAEEQADRVKAAGAADRKRRAKRWTGALVRIASLVTVLSIWEFGGGMLDQSLFATPSRVAVASVGMIASGELWQYLASHPEDEGLWHGLYISSGSGLS